MVSEYYDITICMLFLLVTFCIVAKDLWSMVICIQDFFLAKVKADLIP